MNPRACIIGFPVSHSRSPMVHSHWLELHGIAGEYIHADVSPVHFTDFIRAMPEKGFVGANVTLPHKTALLELSKHRTAEAQAAGAANTLWFENGELCADNTDIAGFLANLDAGAQGWDQGAETALVLGAGGASRGIIHGLKSRGFERVIVANRTLANSEELATVFGGLVQPIHWHETERYLADADLLINSTSLGMAGQPALELHLANLPAHAVVSDAVYVPLETPLLASAKLRGLRGVGGLGMLLHQAVPGFERWFGLRPSVTPELTRLIEADVERGH
ncbi:MAG: shikimate dehydrogenase [Beijerinckiaceae bacterium]